MNTREFEILSKAKNEGYVINQKSVLVRKGRLRWEYFSQMKHNYEDVDLKPLFDTVKENCDDSQLLYQAVGSNDEKSNWLSESDLIDYLEKRFNEHAQDKQDK